MKTFFDSSAFAKRYIEEKGSGRVEQLCDEATALALSVICVPEIVSALNRRVREGSLSRIQYREAKACLAAEVADATIVNLVPSVVADAISILETNAVRAMDALHLACALQWNAELFVSSDERQLSAARKAKLRTKKV
jgi:predicted nucleic acid-binding protein